MFEYIWIFWFSVTILWMSIGLAYRGYVSFLALEEQQLKEEDYDYTEELGDDQFVGATSHPTS